MRQVKLFPGGSNYDLISSSKDKSVKFWKEGQLVQTSQYSNYCYRLNFDSERRLLTVGYGSGITVWSTTDWDNLADLKIGEIVDVRFNSTSTKILAAHYGGKISIIDLQ